jgi:hypothetical protein
MRLVPALGPAGLDDERYRELAMRRAAAFHDPPDDLGDVFDFGLRRLDQQLVIDLQQHAGVQLFGRKRSGDASHRALDDVGGRPLQGRVDRLPLGAVSVRAAPGAADHPGIQAGASFIRASAARPFGP